MGFCWWSVDAVLLDPLSTVFVELVLTACLDVL